MSTKSKVKGLKFAVALGILTIIGEGKSFAQTQTSNYVQTQTPRISGITNDSLMAANNSNNTKVQTAIQYVDGLGRPIQTVQKQASPLGYDIVAPQIYDQYGREVTKYLPYTPQTGTAGSYRANATSTDQNAFYATPPTGSGVTAIPYPFSQTNFDNSPLNRTIEQGAPGAPWQLSTSGVTGSGHTVKLVYTLNNATSFVTDSVNGRQVAMYYAVINSDNSRTLVANGYYAANSLTVTISKDENWVSGRAGTVEEYKDIDGQVVLKRQYNWTGTVVQVISTYYVYDDLGHLAFVLPPLSGADAASAISSTTLNNLCYLYQYDNLGRAIAKKIPGKGWEYVVYNNMDLPVATQDANLAANNQWIFTKYDALNRPIWTGIWNNGGTAISQAALQTILTGISTNLYETTSTTGNGYTNVAWPTSNVTATLTQDYYDGYTAPNIPSNYTVSSGVSKLTRGQPTAKVTAVLNTPANQLWDVMYYDDLGRATKSYAQHYLGGVINTGNYDLTTTTYNFPNQPTTITRAHWNTTSTSYPQVTIANNYLYDQIGRKIKTWEQITNVNSAPTTKTLISKIDYNEIGQVLNKHLHSTDSVNFYQNIAYTYNERGWLVTSSAPLFAMRLDYNTGTNKSYNGNIQYQYWGTPGNLTKYYIYSYDRLNRLLGGASYVNNNEYLAYDVVGNIAGINRYTTNTLTDHLTYNYTISGNPTNQLQSILDDSGSSTGLVAGTTRYSYDANGNELTQTNAANSIQNKIFTYNLLNLPQTVVANTSPTTTTTLTYTYDATGNKLRRTSTGLNNTTDYIAGIQYDGATTPALSFIQTEEGKAVPNGTGYDYFYYLDDNLGNTRVTFDTKSGSATLLQQDDYYPFGLEINTLTNSPKNEYLYNKKELQEETQQYDYGARFYDPVIGRWGTIDWLAEDPTQIDLTPYNYVGNNPISKSDPDGNCPNCVTALIGAGIGGLIGGGAEAISQLYHSGHITSWRAVGGAAVQGGIVGGAAGFTGGASLLVTAGTTAGANIVGGIANRGIQGRNTTLKDVAIDGAVGAVAAIGSHYLQKGLSSLASKIAGNWVSESTSGWSKAAIAYQEQITGVSAGNAYEINGVRFDGLKNGKLLEAKGSYDDFVNIKTGEFQSWFKGKFALLNQAERQLRAANGIPIEWNFSNQKSLDATKKLFEGNGITGIILKYTPSKPQ